ncbi:Ubiquitin carboxyl-terminal hydrolase 12 [Mortierella claussenii]|nr:Ubiquitin carboxyl-terminal hydrolase 12 [Mortierella claussenii]
MGSSSFAGFVNSSNTTSTASAPSKKRKSVHSNGVGGGIHKTLNEGFVGYGVVDVDQGDLQDENQESGKSAATTTTLAALGKGQRSRHKDGGTNPVPRRRKPLDANGGGAEREGEGSGPPPSKRHKTPSATSQQTIPPVSSALLNYFKKVTQPAITTTTTTSTMTFVQDQEAQQSLKALYDRVHASTPASSGSVDRTMKAEEQKEEQLQSKVERRRIDQLLNGRQKVSNQDVIDLSSTENKRLQNQDGQQEKKRGKDDANTISKRPTSSKGRKKAASTKETVSAESEPSSVDGVEMEPRTLDAEGVIQQKSGPSTLSSKLPISGISKTIHSPEESLQTSHRSVLDYFKYRPKSMTSLSKANEAGTEESGLRTKEPVIATVRKIEKIFDLSGSGNDDSNSEPMEQDDDSIGGVSLVADWIDLERPSITLQSQEQKAKMIQRSEEVMQIVSGAMDMNVQRDAEAEQELETKTVQAPRRRRLVRASNLAPKKYCDSSSDDSAKDAVSKKVPPSKSRKSVQQGSQPQHVKGEPSPASEQGAEAAPQVEVESEPESEPEPKHIAASRQFMRNFLGTTTPSTLPIPIEAPSPSTSNVSDSAQDGVVEATKALAPTTRRPLKTYSKVKKVTVAAKKKRVKKSSFSDSERSGSDHNDSDLDDDLSDFMNTKIPDKPDPNQKSITTMFSKASLNPVSSFATAVKPRRKRCLTPASRALLSGGLSNLSNTCYLNSVLQSLRNTRECSQILFAIQEKIQVLEEKLSSQVGVTEYQRSFFDHALGVFRELDVREQSADSNGTETRSTYPTKVIRTLHQGDSLFNSSEQQDAAEFLFYVISQFDDVLKALIQLAKSSDESSSGSTEDLVLDKWQPIDDLFQVGTQTVTHCQRCPSVSTNQDRGIDLTVQIDAENPHLVRDLDWGITETMKMEHMKDDNQRFCEKCNSKEDAHVYHYFTSLPKIMILRLQRYNFMQGAVKLQNSVSCTRRMNFSKWMSQDHQGDHLDYELCAIIVHRGRAITSGHYYVYIKKDVEMETEITEPDGEIRIEKKTFRWLKYNDASVDPVSEEDMARVFSGNVNTSVTSDLSINGSGDVNETGAEAGAGLTDGVKKDPLVSSYLLDDDLATPYVYIYRRLDDNDGDDSSTEK